jgi:hypothetical protein
VRNLSLFTTALCLITLPAASQIGGAVQASVTQSVVRTNTAATMAALDNATRNVNAAIASYNGSFYAAQYHACENLKTHLAKLSQQPAPTACTNDPQLIRNASTTMAELRATIGESMRVFEGTNSQMWESEHFESFTCKKTFNTAYEHLAKFEGAIHTCASLLSETDRAEIARKFPTAKDQLQKGVQDIESQKLLNFEYSQDSIVGSAAMSAQMAADVAKLMTEKARAASAEALAACRRDRNCRNRFDPSGSVLAGGVFPYGNDRPEGGQGSDIRSGPEAVTSYGYSGPDYSVGGHAYGVESPSGGTGAVSGAGGSTPDHGSADHNADGAGNTGPESQSSGGVGGDSQGYDGAHNNFQPGIADPFARPQIQFISAVWWLVETALISTADAAVGQVNQFVVALMAQSVSFLKTSEAMEAARADADATRAEATSSAEAASLAAVQGSGALDPQRYPSVRPLIADLRELQHHGYVADLKAMTIATPDGEVMPVAQIVAQTRQSTSGLTLEQRRHLAKLADLSTIAKMFADAAGGLKPSRLPADVLFEAGRGSRAKADKKATWRGQPHDPQAMAWRVLTQRLQEETINLRIGQLTLQRAFVACLETGYNPRVRGAREGDEFHARGTAMDHIFESVRSRYLIHTAQGHFLSP